MNTVSGSLAYRRPGTWSVRS